MEGKTISEFGVAYETSYGQMFLGHGEAVLESALASKYRGRVQLVFTSPPFPLNHKKRYGNVTGEAYVEWLASFAQSVRQLLVPDGSIVIELGNAWEPRRPIMSTLALRALLAFLQAGDFRLCQQFVCHNPARLPSPAQWVTVERIRVKDSYTQVWWMSPTDRPKADNRRVLKPYSRAMFKLLASGKYNTAERPSQHHIGARSFLRDNPGAIPSNVLDLANTRANDEYQTYCRARGLPAHPARMPAGLAEFFIKFLTEPGDIVLDPFAGSNTTGAVAERLERRWLSIEPREDYVEGSRGRFPDVASTAPLGVTRS
jgi:hypothetical protein